MCIVIDTNCFSSVFHPGSGDHNDFKPIANWITNGKGKVVCGGSTYLKELSRAERYRKLILNLERAGRVRRGDNDNIDKIEKQLVKKFISKDYDDHHLLAIVIDTGCCLVCTKDKGAHRLLQETGAYPKGVRRPSIYSCINCAHLIQGNEVLVPCS